jgi:signal transduction histidine kinase
VRVDGDPAKLRQAVLNLIANAVQIGGDGVSVRVETAAAAGRARVTVADDGPGVPAELASRLFEPFVTARPGGTGLGLAVSRHWVARHGGTLRIESTPGEGTCVRVALPLRRAS